METVMKLSGSIKMRGISAVAEELSASQETQYSSESFSCGLLPSTSPVPETLSATHRLFQTVTNSSQTLHYL